MLKENPKGVIKLAKCPRNLTLLSDFFFSPFRNCITDIDSIAWENGRHRLKHHILLRDHFSFLNQVTRRQNFRLVQIETNCRRRFKVHLK